MNTNNYLDILKDLGLSEQEIDLYVGLLKTGGCSATSLASEVNIKRTTVYPILERLISQGIVTVYEQGGKKLFYPVKPQQLGTLFERKIKSFNKIIPYLEGLAKTDKSIYGVRFIKSKDELKLFYDEILSEYKNKEYYIIGSASTWLNTDRDFFLDFRKKRAENSTRVKLLLSGDSMGEEGQNDTSLLREYKYMPEKYKFKSTIDIYNDKIVIVGPEVDALCVVIAIPPMVDVFRSIFEILWESL